MDRQSLAVNNFLMHDSLLKNTPHFLSLLTSTQALNPGDFVVIVVRLLSCVRHSATPWTAARQASLSFSISQSLHKLMSIESVMPSNHLVLYCPLLLPVSVFPSIRFFSNESALHQVTKVLELQLQHQSFQRISTGLISLLSEGLSSLLQHHSLKV